MDFECSGGQPRVCEHQEKERYSMTTVLNKSKLHNLANEIWKSAERLEGKFKAYEYQSVILPIIVIRRLECVLIDWRKKKTEEIRMKRPKSNEKELETLVEKLELNDEMSKISKLELNLHSQINALDQYRKSLIHECVTGKRRITEEDMRVIQQY